MPVNLVPGKDASFLQTDGHFLAVSSHDREEGRGERGTQREGRESDHSGVSSYNDTNLIKETPTPYNLI